MKPCKILIIGDDTLGREELEILLAGNGYESFAVSDISDAVSYVKGQKADLILWDFIRLRGNGPSVCERLRSVIDLPFLFVTDGDIDRKEVDALMASGDDFIERPYMGAALLAKINSLL